MNVRRILSVVLPLLFVAIFFSIASVASAQDNSSMTGVVTDATGAVVPGTVVTLTNPSNGASFTETTDNKGSYRFAIVPPGDGYKVTFAHQGFSTAIVSNISLAVAVTRTQNAKLTAGSVESI
jgi:hypothetical protein